MPQTATNHKCILFFLLYALRRVEPWGRASAAIIGASLAARGGGSRTAATWGAHPGRQMMSGSSLKLQFGVEITVLVSLDVEDSRKVVDVDEARLAGVRRQGETGIPVAGGGRRKIG